MLQYSQIMIKVTRKKFVLKVSNYSLKILKKKLDIILCYLKNKKGGEEEGEAAWLIWKRLVW